MPYCQYCKGKIDEDAVVCPRCGESLIGGDTEWQELRIQEKVDEAKHRANMYIILAVVLATVGIVAGSMFCAASSGIGFFGIVLVCLGVGCTASADRHEHKARSFKNQLRR
jgi:RNA polymerase subunit RPABC4/transcription elongation factor Spt4